MGFFLTPSPSKHWKSLWKTKNLVFLFSDWSYRNRKNHEIWGCLKAFLGVFGLIYGGVWTSPTVSFRVKKVEFSVSKFRPAKKPSHIFHILIFSCCGGTQLAVTTLVRNTYNRQLFTFRWLCTPTQSSSIRSPIFVHDQFSVKFLPFFFGGVP